MTPTLFDRDPQHVTNMANSPKLQRLARDFETKDGHAMTTLEIIQRHPGIVAARDYVHQLRLNGYQFLSKRIHRGVHQYTLLTSPNDGRK